MNKETLNTIFAAYKLLCYHRRNLFVCVSCIARPSGRNQVGLYEGDVRYGSHCCFQYKYLTCDIFPRRELVAVFKVSCFPFLNCFASFLLDIIFLPALHSRTVYSLLLHLNAHEKISLPIYTRFVFLTQAINLSRLG